MANSFSIIWLMLLVVSGSVECGALDIFPPEPFKRERIDFVMQELEKQSFAQLEGFSMMSYPSLLFIRYKNKIVAIENGAPIVAGMRVEDPENAYEKPADDGVIIALVLDDLADPEGRDRRDAVAKAAVGFKESVLNTKVDGLKIHLFTLLGSSAEGGDCYKQVRSALDGIANSIK